MSLYSLSTLLGGLLLSRRGRGLAARHAGKIALATLAWRLWKGRRAPIRAAARGEVRARPAVKASRGRHRWSRRNR